MAVLSELRYPTTTFSKLVSSTLALVLLVLVALVSISGVLLYQVLKPPKNIASFDLSVMMGHPSEVRFSLENGMSRDGWFFPGLRGAPTIILCHGYLSQRSDVLTLSASLQDQQYNVFVFDFSGHGSNQGMTTLGYKEVGELRSALQALTSRDDVDPNRFGIWGNDMGAYAALELAASDHRVAALAVDSVYNDPSDMVRLQLSQSGLAVFPLVAQLTNYGFRLINYSFRAEPPLTARMGRLAGVPKLFIEIDSRPELAESTTQLYLVAPDPKDQWRGRVNYAEMSDDDRKIYENLIVSFFLKSLPLEVPASAPPAAGAPAKH